MRLLLLLMMLTTLGGCGLNDGSNDRFAAGKWELQAWFEADGNPGKAGLQTHIVEISASDAAYPPASVFVTRFYHGVKDADLNFSNGQVSGNFQQRPVDPIAGHNVPITGTYASDRFSITFEYQAFGMKLRQKVEGKLTEPA